MSKAFEYLKANGAMLAEDYPYNESYPMRGNCRYDPDIATAARVARYTFAESGDINMIK